MRVSIALAAIFSVAIVASSRASSDDAWAANARAGRQACIKVANLLRPTVSTAIGFSDRIGRDAMLVRGTYPQPHMKGAKGTALCLYDRRTRRAEAQEAKGWTAPAR